MHLTCIGRVGASEKNEMYRRQMVKEKRQGIVERQVPGARFAVETATGGTYVDAHVTVLGNVIP
jgi:hypothetical protein